MAKFAKEPKLELSMPDAVTGASSGLALVNVNTPASAIVGAWTPQLRAVKWYVSFKKQITSDADFGFGQKIADMPQGTFVPLWTEYDIDFTCPTGLSIAVGADDGEQGLGTVIASGAVDELGGTATFEDIGGVPSALVACSANATTAQNDRKFVGTLTAFDGTATAKDIFYNVAISANQTSQEYLTIQGYVTLVYLWLGDD